jgi:hypothetical protein
MHCPDHQAPQITTIEGDSGKYPFTLIDIPRTLSKHTDHTLRWMIWQDTFRSFTYERPPSTINNSNSIPASPSNPSSHSFAERIFALGICA